MTAGPDPTGPPGRDPAHPDPPAWSASRVLGGILVVLVLITLEGAVVSILDPGFDTLAATLVLQALVATTFVGVALAMTRTDAGSIAPRALGLRRPIRPAVRSAALAYVVYIACAYAVALLLDPRQEDITRDLGFGEGALGSIAAGALIIVAAPLSEEIFFRGFVFAGLRRAAPFALAAVVSAVVWALLHFNYEDPEGSWGVVVQLSVFGVALAWLYERTGSVWPPIALHALNNGLAFALLTA